MNKAYRTDALKRLSKTLMNRADLAFELSEELELELRKMEEERDLYKGEYSKAVEACEFMQSDDRVRSKFFIGQRTTVEGVAALKKDRDELLKEFAAMKVERDKYKQMILDTGIDKLLAIAAEYDRIHEGKWRDIADKLADRLKLVECEDDWAVLEEYKTNKTTWPSEAYENYTRS